MSLVRTGAQVGATDAAGRGTVVNTRLLEREKTFASLELGETYYIRIHYAVQLNCSQLWYCCRRMQ